MTKVIKDFDPNKPNGIEIRYTPITRRPSEIEESGSENEEEQPSKISLQPKSIYELNGSVVRKDSSNNKPGGGGGGRGIEQFILDEQNTTNSATTILPTKTNHQHNIGNNSTSNKYYYDTRCGLGSYFSPEWIQIFASKQAFMLVYSLLAVIQGMSWAYFTATITTLEKRFKISSQTAGLVMTGNELSQVLFSILIAYYGSHGHRPRWIAVGVVFSAFSFFLLASPHLFYGPGQDALSLTEEYIITTQNLKDTQPMGMITTSPPILHRNIRSISYNQDADDEDDDIPHILELEEPEFQNIDKLSYTPVQEEEEQQQKFDIVQNGMTQIISHIFSSTEKAGGVNTFGPGNNDNQTLSDIFTHMNTTKNLPRVQSHSAKRNRVQLCDRNLDPTNKKLECNNGDESIVPLILIFLSQFVAGIGVLLFFSLGGPYLDDNIKKTQSPMLFGITMCLRLIGPTLGFIFGSICLKIYISPSLTPIIDPTDPRWMGAWWLGWVVLGLLMFFTSFFIALFPRELPESVQRRHLKNIKIHSIDMNDDDDQTTTTTTKGLLTVPQSNSDMIRSGSQVLFTAEITHENPIPKLSEMSKAVKTLLQNKINLYNNLSGVFYIFSAIGYWTYMPKYMETIFMQTAANAALISGFVSIGFQAAGLLISGALISRFQPSARKLAAWNVFLGFLYVIVKIGFTQMGCNPGEIAHGDSMNGEGSSWNLTMSCNTDCNCKVNKMLPVCYNETNTVYFSACHAGCTTYMNGTGSNCSCLPDPIHDTVTLGTCSKGCFSAFVIFLTVNAVIKLLDSSGRIGNMLVSYRCVDPKDKSLSIGLSIFLISIFAMLPSPIVFGAIIDSVCLVWGSKCGGKGNCWLYNGERLRYVFNLTAAAFTFIGAAFDCMVWYHVGELDLYDEDKNIARAKAKKDKNAAAAMLNVDID